MNLTEATEFVAMLQVAWPEYAWTEQSPRVYAIGLDDVPFAAAEAIYPTLVKSFKFAPKPSEVRDALALPDAEDEYADQIPNGKQAWEEIFDGIKRVGHRRMPEFSHPLIARTARAFGWREICGCEDKQMNTLRAQVERFHDGYRADAIGLLKRGTPMELALASWADQSRAQARIAGLVPVALPGGDDANEWAESA